MKYFGCSTLFLLLIFFVSIVSAADNDEAAKTAFNVAKSLYENHEYAEAAKKFREAYELKPTWKLQFNIGQAEAADKRYGKAIEAFETYLSQGGDEINEEREDEIFQQIEKLKKKTGSVMVNAPKGSVVFIDGVKRGVAPLSSRILVAAGAEHMLMVKLDDVVILEKKFKPWTGDKMSIDAEAPDEVMAPVEPESETDIQEEMSDEKSSPLTAGGAVILGVGVASLATGAAMGILAMKGRDKLSEDCPDNICVGSSYNDRIDGIKLKGTLSTVFYAAGGALATTGLIFLIAGKKKRESQDVAITPVITNSFAGLTFNGRF